MTIQKYFHDTRFKKLPTHRKTPSMREQTYFDTNMSFEMRDHIKPLVQACGMTKLKQLPYFKVYSEAYSRKMLLIDILNHHRDSDTLTDYLLADIKAHMAIVDAVFTRLDINNTIDHPLDGLMEESGWNIYKREWTDKDIRHQFFIPEKLPAHRDKIADDLIKGQALSRQTYCKQRLHNELTQAHEKGWYVVFDTLTLSDEGLFRFYKDLKNNQKEPISEFTRKIGRTINKALGRKKGDSYTDVYKYFICPEYGSKTGRLHWHVVHLMKVLPLNTRDPNAGKRVRCYREVSTLKGNWPYGFTSPIGVRYSGDAFGRSQNWLIPVDKLGKPMEYKPLMAIVHYVAKYVNKTTDLKINSKFGADDKWQHRIKMLLSYTNSQLFRVRTSRGFGMNLPTMANLTDNELVELTKLHWSTSPFNKILKENARKQLQSRLAMLTIKDLPEVAPPAINLLKSLRDSIQKLATFNLQNFIDLMTPKLLSSDISKPVREYLENGQLTRETFEIRFNFAGGGK